MSKRIISTLINGFCLLAIVAISTTARAQSDWQTFSPEGEEFSVVMPKNPKMEESEEPYHRMTLKTRLYLSQSGSQVVAVASMSGIKANSAMYTEFQRLNSYVDAFKNWFPQKVRKDVVAKLTQTGDKVVNGNAGREYKLTIGDLSGTAQMFATRKRFYAVVILDTRKIEKDDELTAKFFSSLSLPEKGSQAPPAAAASTEKNIAGGDVAQTSKPSRAEGGDDTQKPSGVMTPSEVKPGENAASEKPSEKPGDIAPINGGVLNGKALYLPAPEYPPIAAQAKASGSVTVSIMVDELGNVISAHAVNGHPLLQATSVAAARQARFSPTTLNGTPVKVSGVLQYNFVAQ
jgi:TonB family protein